MATLNANPVVYQTKKTPQKHINNNNNNDNIYNKNKYSNIDYFSKQYNIFDNNNNIANIDIPHNELDTELDYDPITSSDVFDLLRNLNDPEHPLTLEQLNVCSLDLIRVIDNNNESYVYIQFTPTIPHCSMATLIGLSIRVKLLRALPQRFKVHISITPGTHASEYDINKQLNDKERVSAALENEHLLDVVNKAIAHTDKWPENNDIQFF